MFRLSGAGGAEQGDSEERWLAMPRGVSTLFQSEVFLKS